MSTERGQEHFHPLGVSGFQLSSGADASLPDWNRLSILGKRAPFLIYGKTVLAVVVPLFTFRCGRCELHSLSAGSPVQRPLSAITGVDFSVQSGCFLLREPLYVEPEDL